ncbi:hypothetical protein D9M68_252130 [compost metagenome]
MVPPVMYLTGTPVCRVNSLPMLSSMRSRKLPPQVLTTKASWAHAAVLPSVAESAQSAKSLRIVIY